LEIGHRDTANELLLRDPALLDPLAASATSYPGGHNEGFGDSFKQLFIDFYRAIESGNNVDQRSYPTFEDGHQEILICEAILNSHQRQSWVEIGDTNK
jgi:predicted dehydrogenase